MARRKPRNNTSSNSIHPAETYHNKGAISDDTELTLVSLSDNSRANSPKPDEKPSSEAEVISPVQSPVENNSHKSTDRTPSVVITTSPDVEETSLSSSIFSRSPTPGKLGAFNGNGDSLTVNGWQRVRDVSKQRTVIRVLQGDSPSPKPSKKKHRQLSGTKKSIPVLPVPLAVLMLVLNIMVPGLGTIVSSLTFLCGYQPYDDLGKNNDPEHKCGLMCTNIMVGGAQLLTVTFLLVGWFWSVSWGILMVQLARDKPNEMQDSGSYVSDNP